jgi:hypothetical protein
VRRPADSDGVTAEPAPEVIVGERVRPAGLGVAALLCRGHEDDPERTVDAQVGDDRAFVRGLSCPVPAGAGHRQPDRQRHDVAPFQTISIDSGLK